jgi:putative membrane protein
MKKAHKSHLILLALTLLVLAWSGCWPYDRFTWLLEVAPGISAILILSATYQRFRLTKLCYTLIALHICVLCVGGHYTYARVPVFDWLRPVFGWERNHYDRLGHFMQGLVPAMIAREIFVRLNVLQRKNWMPFLILCVCLAISAFYELIEWWSAILAGALAIDFIGSQGDVWDTQGDMFMALIGATCALLFLSHLHDRALRKIEAGTGTAT